MKKSIDNPIHSLGRSALKFMNFGDLPYSALKLAESWQTETFVSHVVWPKMLGTKFAECE